MRRAADRRRRLTDQVERSGLSWREALSFLRTAGGAGLPSGSGRPCHDPWCHPARCPRPSPDRLLSAVAMYTHDPRMRTKPRTPSKTIFVARPTSTTARPAAMPKQAKTIHRRARKPDRADRTEEANLGILGVQRLFDLVEKALLVLGERHGALLHVCAVSLAAVVCEVVVLTSIRADSQWRKLPAGSRRIVISR